MSVRTNRSSSARNGWFAKSSKPETIVSRARKTRPRLPPSSTAFSARIGACHRQFSWMKKGTPGFAARAHHALGGGEVVRHRLLADDGLAVRGRELHEPGVGRRVGDDVEEVDVLPAQQLLRVVVDRPDAQLPPEGLGLRASAVVEGHAPGPRQLAPGAELVPRPEPGSEQGEAERRRGRGQASPPEDSDRSRNAGRLSMERGPVQARSPASGLSLVKGLPHPALAGDTPSDEPGGPSMHRFALALVLAMTTAGPSAANDAAKAPAPEDRYLWLEDVTGEKALDWARARNAESAKVLETGDFAALEKRILDILDSDARIPYVQKLGPWYYNFWRDAKNPRGLWRRTTLAEYRKDAPGLGDGDRPRRARRGGEGELGLARRRLPEAGVQALPRPAVARRRRRRRRARVRPRGEGLREGRLLPARGQEQASAGSTATRSTSARTSAPAR